MKTLLASSFPAHLRSSSLLACGLTLVCTPLITARIAGAKGEQNVAIVAPAANAAATPATSALAAAPLPTAPDINVLIVALDDISALAATTAPVYVPPTAPAATGATTPIEPADGTPAIVTPTAFNGPLAVNPLAVGPLWQWRASAQKKSKEQKRLEKEAEDAKIYNPNPVPQTPYTPPGKAPVLAPSLGGGNPNAPIVRAPDALVIPENATVPAAPLSVGAPGRARLMALPLRRALNAQGYKDVQVVTPESATIVRAIGEGRLTSRVLDELKSAMTTLTANAASGAPDDINATITAGRAASRIGQATGYRAVVGFTVGEPLAIGVVGAAATPDATTQKIAANMIVADAQREIVEPLKFIETGDTPEIWQETGGVAGAQLLDGTLRDWPANSSDNRAAMGLVHFESARAAYDRGDLGRAQDELNQSIALDSSRPQTYLLRGDILNAIEPGNGYNAYQRAVELNSTNGQDWARIAAAYTYAKTPDWPSARNAGERALALNYDSAALRVAMATMQYGRATLFRKADYAGKADEAETEARGHLERALQLAPNDPTAVRLLSKNLIDNRRFEEAARTLDRIAPRYPNDLEIQAQYATALGEQIGREEEAFAAYARVWKLSGQKMVTVDAITYRKLASGFDQRLFNLGKVAVQLSRGVASRAILRETAMIQLSKLKEEMEDAQDSIAIMQSAAGVSATAVASRVFAADLMDQSLEAFQTYLDTGQGSYFERGDGLYRQAVAQLNTARSTQ